MRVRMGMLARLRKSFAQRHGKGKIVSVGTITRLTGELESDRNRSNKDEKLLARSEGAMRCSR
jgi:hypothetical protein